MTLPRVQPIIPTRRKEPFDDPEWLFDLKYDGFRGLCYIEKGRCRFISRNDNVLSRFGVLAHQVGLLDVDEAVIDGEVIVADETGRPQFYELLRVPRSASYVAFDILWTDGTDLRSLPLGERPAAAARHFAGEIADHLRGAIRHRPRPRTLRTNVFERPGADRGEAPGRSLRAAG